MIPKLIFNNSFGFDDAVVSMVPLHRRGVDQSWMVKRASHGLFSDILSSLTPQPGKTIIHVLAVGDEEMYGPNRNGDGFSREDNRTAHTSFKEIGNVFKHHKNDDPFKAVGDVIATGHHSLMSRIELLLGLDNEKCSKEVDALESGKDLPVSMGSMQDFDVCSICNHKAPTAADHCPHIKNMLGIILSDGRRVYMKNPKPKYFDISLVFKPADRIAYALRKVAADSGRVIGGHDLAQMFGLRLWNSPKTAALQTLAAMNKRIPVNLRKVTQPTKLDSETITELKKQAQLQGIDQLLGFLHANNWLLSPSDFGEVIGHKDPAACAQAVEEYGDLDDLIEDKTEVKSLELPIVQQYIPLSELARENLTTCTSMEPVAANSRSIRILITPSPTPKMASTIDEAEARGLASLYQHYKLAFATAHCDRNDILTTVAATF